MRLKHTYNCLGSGCLFIYRGIFSGLSNETGAAPYNALAGPNPLCCPFTPIHFHCSFTHKYCFMSKQTIQDIAIIIAQYDPVLHRYAHRLITHNKAIASDIVKWVFEELYEEGQLWSGPHIRSLLMNKVHSKSMAFNKALLIDSAHRLKLSENQTIITNP